MKFVTSNLDVEVKYKKAGNELLIPRPPIRLKASDALGNITTVEKLRVVESKRFLYKGKEVTCESQFTDPETKKEVPGCEVLEVLEHYAEKLLTPSGNLIERDDEGEDSRYVELKENGGKKEIEILYFAVQPDGSESECRPFTRTNVIEIKEENWVPSTTIEQFLITNVYEVFNPKEAISRQLYEEAEKRLKADQIGITTFSWGNGFVQYYAFLVPFMQNGKFVWLLKLTDTKVAYNYLQDIPGTKIPIRESAPTLNILPPIQLVVPPQKKKKQQSN